MSIGLSSPRTPRPRPEDENRRGILSRSTQRAVASSLHSLRRSRRPMTNHPPASPPENCDSMGQSETFKDAPDRNLSLAHVSNPMVPETCDTMGQSETSEDMQDRDPPLTLSPRRLPPLGSSPDRYEKHVESETCADRPDRNATLAPSSSRSCRYVTPQDA